MTRVQNTPSEGDTQVPAGRVVERPTKFLDLAPGQSVPGRLGAPVEVDGQLRRTLVLVGGKAKILRSHADLMSQKLRSEPEHDVEVTHDR